jgi:hypothetical protein
MSFKYIIAYIATAVSLIVGTPYFMVLGVIEAWETMIATWKEWEKRRRADDEQREAD